MARLAKQVCRAIKKRPDAQKKEEAAKKDGEVIDLSGAVGIESGHVEAEEDCDSDEEVELLKKVCTKSMIFEAPPVEEKKKGKKKKKKPKAKEDDTLDE